MSTIKLKNILIKQIAEINDFSFLEAIKTILDTKIDHKVYTLSPEQDGVIGESEKDIRQGNVFTNDQVNEEFQEWLKEK